MSELKGLYALWYRELKVYTREKSRIVSSLVQPLMWLVVFGGGLGSAFEGAIATGLNYQQFIYPGILAMTILFGSIFFGLYIIMDKRVDFLKETFVAPLNRSTIFFGKVLGGATDGLIEVVLLVILGALFFNIHFTVFSVLATALFIVLLSISMVSLGLSIGAVMSSPEGFGLVSGFLIFPLFFLSGALFPIKSLPSWLSPFILANPVTYAVDGLRGVIVGAGSFAMGIDLIVIAAFALVMVGLGTWLFSRMRI